MVNPYDIKPGHILVGALPYVHARTDHYIVTNERPEGFVRLYLVESVEGPDIYVWPLTTQKEDKEWRRNCSQAYFFGDLQTGETVYPFTKPNMAWLCNLYKIPWDELHDLNLSYRGQRVSNAIIKDMKRKNIDLYTVEDWALPPDLPNDYQNIIEKKRGINSDTEPHHEF